MTHGLFGGCFCRDLQPEIQDVETNRTDVATLCFRGLEWILASYDTNRD